MALFAAMADLLVRAGRAILRAPGVSAAIMLTVALAAGGNLAIGAVLDRLLFRGPSAVAAPSGLRRIYLERHLCNGTPYVTADFSYPDFLDFASTTQGNAGVVGYARRDGLLRETGRWVGLGFAGPRFFSALGVRAVRGRFFSDDEASPPAADDVAVVSFHPLRIVLGPTPRFLVDRSRLTDTRCE